MKPAPMDDDVLKMREISAKALGRNYQAGFIVNGQLGYPWTPDTDPGQAFELLCWLAERGVVMICFQENDGFTFAPTDNNAMDFDCTTPAELRLSIMRAVVKVHKEKS